MLFVKCSLFPSIFAVLLLLCLINVLLERGHALKCKRGIETETFKATDQEIEKMHKSKCPQAAQCVAAFCSSAENGFYFNMWACSPFGPESKAKCEKEGHDNANKIRAGLENEFKIRAPAATDWKCTCHYGAKGKDMDNEQFVAPVVKQKPKAKDASSRHGVGMPLMAIGLIIGILPLFHVAILDRLNP